MTCSPITTERKREREREEKRFYVNFATLTSSLLLCSTSCYFVEERTLSRLSLNIV